ncbi:hypothetical protein ACBY01_12595 [Sphingomonas sp. ac-8]|uniref:hypothetical protein n=1 Tax=Sphingomonas sp. ac-8 TaxID=3242977 RepID=UPI003A7FB92D
MGWTMLLLAALQTQSPPPPPPLHGGPTEQVCPIGGERFSAWQAGSYSTYGQRPDGKPYSYLPFPLPIPECPTNHLVIFDEFDAKDIARLTPLIASERYRAILGETVYYRAFWLADQLGRPPEQSLSLLMRAIWEVRPGTGDDTGMPDLQRQAARYQQTFVERVDRLPTQVPQLERAWLEARAANTLREMEAFGRAERFRTRALASAVGLAQDDSPAAYLEQLAVVIARHDASAEPLDMIPSQQATFACVDLAGSRDAFVRKTCDEPERAKAVAEVVRGRAARD